MSLSIARVFYFLLTSHYSHVRTYKVVFFHGHAAHACPRSHIQVQRLVTSLHRFIELTQWPEGMCCSKARFQESKSPGICQMFANFYITHPINANYLSLNFRVCQRPLVPSPLSACAEPTEYSSGISPLAKNARKAQPKPSPSRLDLPHPDHRPRKSQRKTISDVPVVIFHPNSLHMHLHDLFLRFIKPCVGLCRHDSHHYDFLHLLGSHPPPKISTWTSTFGTKSSFKNVI